MEHRRLGRTGLRVSSVGLGTMTWGRDTDEIEARDQLDVFLDAGGTLLDTAASYCEGLSEEVIGSLLREHVDRQDVVLVSKAGVRTWRTGDRPAAADASRGTLLDTLDASLRRLGTDHLDLWLVQVPDATTPMEETVDALRLAVSSGRARYVGVSNHPAWASVHAADLLREHTGPGMAAVEVEHSLLARGAEREILPAAGALGFGVIGYAPLGRGVLSGKYRATVPADSRGASPHLRSYVAPYLQPGREGVVEAVATAAAGLDRKPVEVALAWAREAPGVASTVVGARTPAQLQGALASEDLVLPAQIRHALDDVTALPA
ncbi:MULTISPECIES: aldo/keto reductase [unclassified Actinomyces]|uniref:aldo/keto reductase n=1 Tax=unclassified Actinomyces TaxID=2609248 RepID=UPI002017133B|nr:MULTISPECIES: aldo/keto reductase [unclassified Actinomyces]MCL3777526.1 aldo/keto reductase [Actinomyces sp. AC-20-1]MCL3790332.1 aldo/keto reductase [Actinomyces sp. 187325]MCL3792615.1 aldo/keto reductase [Actinomyces sp. 186855]MCL3795108.1 aldo/keto reductase [Actinomyces sp. 217892]